jgi:hypothetical protein
MLMKRSTEKVNLENTLEGATKDANGVHAARLNSGMVGTIDCKALTR